MDQEDISVETNARYRLESDVDGRLLGGGTFSKLKESLILGMRGEKGEVRVGRNEEGVMKHSVGCSPGRSELFGNP